MVKPKIIQTRRFLKIMESAGIGLIEIVFQGGGDSGQIEEVNCYDLDLEPCEFNLEQKPPRRKDTYKEIIYDWFNDFIDRTTSLNWTNNSGGEGKVEIFTEEDEARIEFEIEAFIREHESFTYDVDDIKNGRV